MGKIPVSLIIDDSGPVNMFYFHDVKHEHELLVPPGFARKFAGICKRNGIKGKFSMVPMPAGLGRLDGKLCRVPAKYVRDYIRIVKQDIEPCFSITPEILTHFRAYDIKKENCGHVFEDVLFSSLSAEDIAELCGTCTEDSEKYRFDTHRSDLPLALWNRQ